jgi:aminopeptidase N
VRTDVPQTIYLRNYTPPAYAIERIDLRFEIGEEQTIVTSRLIVERTSANTATGVPLVLHGQDMKLCSLKLDGVELPANRFRVDAESLTIADPPRRCTVEITTSIRPQDNTALEGLYRAGGMFCTQCEAEGFRRITYYLDRPDVMAHFTTMIIADRQRYPVLLSNGNLVAHGELPGGRHWVKWEDPFRKPCYLFALVAGDLAHIEDHYTTRSDRRVLLRIYTEHENIDQTHHAMASLKGAMAWDEERFGLEYDLDIYMIVAVGFFNMGAMENKGLNVFNTSCVLARSDTATDRDFERVESVIGHEYFHNWTGNRVTCRDWFQLTLKEGLTVFRDQEFTADLHSRSVKRIDDVRLLRAHQFPEDSGPMAHPIQPQSYIEINNFYTATVYEKGAEVVRMIQTLVGREGFCKGLELYFRRHDGQAVTTDEFAAAMADANGIDLAQFKRWYRQAGTPLVRIKTSHDPAARAYTLNVEQTASPASGQRLRAPLHIPLAVGLLDDKGADIPLRLEGENPDAAAPTRVLDVKARTQAFRFVDVPCRPVPSFLRDFSAPVIVEADLTDDELAFLFARDSDPFNRWEAGQQLAVRIMLRIVEARQLGNEPPVPAAFFGAMRDLLTAPTLDPAFIAEAIQLPSELYLAERMKVVDVEGIHQVREHLRRSVAGELRRELTAAYEANRVGEGYRFHGSDAGRRSLRNAALACLATLADEEEINRCTAQYHAADNMSDALTAFTALTDIDCDDRVEVIGSFYERWHQNALVVDKWFAVQAGSRRPTTLADIQGLLRHPAFDLKNPNRVRALVGTLAHRNPAQFHHASGEGYRIVASTVIELDPVNPQVAARLAGSFSRWRRYDQARQSMMRQQLEEIAGRAGLSRDVYEIVSKSLD